MECNSKESKEHGRNNKNIRELLKGIINKREEAIKAGEVPKHELLGILLECNFKESKGHGRNNKNIGMVIEYVIDDCKLFYFARQETTSRSLVWTMILLSQNKNGQDRAREEVLQVFVSNRTPTIDVLSHIQVVTYTITYNVFHQYSPREEMQVLSIATDHDKGKFGLVISAEL